MNYDINDFVPSLLYPRTFKKNNYDLSLTQNSCMNRSLSLKINTIKKTDYPDKIFIRDKESLIDDNDSLKEINYATTLNISDTEEIQTVIIEDTHNESNFYICKVAEFERETGSENKCDRYVKCTNETVPILSISSENDKSLKSDETIHYSLNETAIIHFSFVLSNCNNLNVGVENAKLKKLNVTQKNNNTNVECDLMENFQISMESVDERMSQDEKSPPKDDVVFVLKKRKVSEPNVDDPTVLNLKINAIDRLRHVIVQPPNYKLVKRKKINANTVECDNSKLRQEILVKNEQIAICKNLRQTFIDSYFRSNVLNNKKLNFGSACDVSNDNQAKGIGGNDTQDMSKNSGIKCDVIGRTIKTKRDECEKSPRPKQNSASPRQDIKPSCSDAARGSSPKIKKDSVGSYSPRRNFDLIQFSLPVKSKSNKTSTIVKTIPHYKIVAGTHFAVDAFSYGDIPNVKHYFLTHFHSDHYSGLKKGFNKILFCSKITADLCISRIGVSSKCIHIINVDDTMRIEGVEVTAVDANHCPGAIMLVFTLPNGKTMLHTGDFRATPNMESYPIFWNRDIHTVYLDTTYCNPRYDFPTQDQSIEMALHLLRQKKIALEKAGKKFSSVLIVCGTYTIGKERFFLGVARRVGCSVWACPEKERVLRSAPRATPRAPPRAAQLHVVPMRDLTHLKLKSYLDSLEGAFSEIVAFKPSGWENGKNSCVEKDSVTIYGIPYSEHSSFSELIRFVKFVQPKLVVPTVDISGGIKAVQKFFPCPLVHKEDLHCQSKVTDFFKAENSLHVSAVT